MPDRAPRDLPERLAPKCRVLPVPIEPIPRGEDRDARLILWNHRWEYDKRPDLFADAMLSLAEAGVEFRLALLGKRPRRAPRALAMLRERLGDRIVADGMVARREYRELLGRAGIVVSTAAHEFQGLAMLEAVSAGAIPVVPDALCYPEQYPPQFRYAPGDASALANRIADCLSSGALAAPDMNDWYADSLAGKWREVLKGSMTDRPDRQREAAG